MAAIENLEIIVDVDISDAIEDLKVLQQKLGAIADKIRDVDRVGSSGISVHTDVQPIQDDLTHLKAQLELWESRNELNIDTNVDGISGGVAAASGANFNPSGMLVDPSGGGGGGGVSGSGGGGSTRNRAASSALRTFTSDMQSLIPNLSDFNLRMSDMHNLLARLVPLILVFVGAIPAAVTAIYTLAAAAIAATAALGAMAAFGAMGFAMQGGQFNAQRLSDAFERVRQDFLDAFAPLANQLQPLFEDGLSGLERFFDAVAKEGDALVSLTDQARAFGEFVFNFVPEALRSVAGLVAGFDSIFANIGNFLNREFANVMRTIVQIALEAIPALAHLTLVIGRMIQTIVEISSGFLHMTAVIVRVIGAIGQLLNILPISSEALGVVMSALLAASSAAFVLSSSFVALGYSALVSAGRSIIQLAASVLGYIGVSKGAIASTLGLAASFRALAAAIALTGIGAIIVGLGFIASEALSAKSNIEGMTDALKDFDSVQSGVGNEFGGSGDDPYGFTPDDPRGGSGGGGVTVFEVDSGSDPQEARSNMERASWIDGRTTGG